jgi:hypothetical protein
MFFECRFQLWGNQNDQETYARESCKSDKSGLKHLIHRVQKNINYGLCEPRLASALSDILRKKADASTIRNTESVIAKNEVYYFANAGVLSRTNGIPRSPFTRRIGKGDANRCE